MTTPRPYSVSLTLTTTNDGMSTSEVSMALLALLNTPALASDYLRLMDVSIYEVTEE